MSYFDRQEIERIAESTKEEGFREKEVADRSSNRYISVDLRGGTDNRQEAATNFFFFTSHRTQTRTNRYRYSAWCSEFRVFLLRPTEPARSLSLSVSRGHWHDDCRLIKLQPPPEISSSVRVKNTVNRYRGPVVPRSRSRVSAPSSVDLSERSRISASATCTFLCATITIVKSNNRSFVHSFVHCSRCEPSLK